MCASAGQVTSTPAITPARQWAERSSRPACSWAVVGVALLISLLAAVLVSEALLRGIRVERLRDAPA
ncbi:hypothetical protein GCM10020216_011870 [Nonomuraea helvata]